MPSRAMQRVPKLHVAVPLWLLVRVPVEQLTWSWKLERRQSLQNGPNTLEMTEARYQIL